MSALLDYANLDLASTPGVPPPGLAGPSQSPVATAQTARTILGQHTEVLVQSYADRVFVLITQLGRIGSLIQISPPPLSLPPPITSTASSLFPSLPAPNPSTSLTPLFGVAPSPHIGALYDLYANQVGAIVFEGTDEMMGVSRPVLMGIALKDKSGGEEGVGEDERETFGEVMKMVGECRVW